MEGRFVFQDVNGGKSTTNFLGITSGATLVTLAGTLSAYSNAEIVEASVLETEDLSPANKPSTDPPFDSIGVRARIVTKITDSEYPVDEPKILAPTLYCPVSTIVTVSGGQYVIPTETAETIVAAIGIAIGWDLTYQYSEIFGVQV
jgi:hypothetical protein